MPFGISGAQPATDKNYFLLKKSATIPLILEWYCILKPISEPHDFYTEQLEAMEAFFLNPAKSTMRLILDPEFRNMPINYLVQREDKADFPHLLVGFFEPFVDPVVWRDSLIEMTNAEISANVEEGRSICATSTQKIVDSPLVKRNVWREFIAGIEDFSENLPDHVGALIFVLDPAEIGDTAEWLDHIRFFADRNSSSWLKFLVLEPRSTQPLAPLADHPRVDTLLFWMSPEEIEKRADHVLKHSGGLKGYS